MSRTKVQLVSNIVGNVSGGASFTGIVTAAGGFSGSITGTASSASFATTSFALSGTPNITVGSVTASSAVVGSAVTINASGIVGGAATFTNLTVNGTQTIINTTNLEITDKTVGIASTASPTNSYADGAGIVIYGTTNKTLTWDNGNTRLAFNTDVYAPRYYGDGSGLTGVSAGLELKQAGSSVGTAITQVNFASGATLTTASSGISTITIAAGITTTASSPSANTVVTLNLSSAQHHELTLSAGITTITCSGGSFGDSHSVVLIQPSSGIATVGFSTYFLFPSGSSPVMSSGSGKIDLISFVVRRVGAAGTQLLASAGLDYQ